MKKILILSLLFLSNNLFCQDGWQWINPLPYIYNAEDVTSIDNITYILAGKNGLIFRTSNSGTDWISVNDPNYVHNNLNSIYFLNNLTGFIAGDSGIYLKTTDKGISWINHYTGFSFNLMDIYFINSNTGFSSGFENIIKTTNGGIQWFSISDTIKFNHLYLEKPIFTDANTGWIIADYQDIYLYSYLYKTSNSGMNWNISFSDNHIVNYQFLNASTGFLASINGYYYGKSCLFKTTNSGLNWNRINFPDSTGGITNFWFRNENTGYVINRNIHRTTNGGINWSKDTLNFGFSSAKINNDLFLFYDYQNLQKSSNFGLTWDKINQGFIDDVNIMTFFNPSTGIIRKNNTELLKTTDEGLNWIELDTLTKAPFRKISYKDEMNLYAIAYQYDTIHISNDGGYTWQQSDLGDNLTIEDIQFVDNVLYVAAEKIFDKNYLYKSSDNGATWRIIELDSSGGYSKIKFFDKNNGYFKSARRLFRTMDGGEKWTLLLYNPEINFRFDNFDFIDLNTGWLTHMSGTVYITSNAGSNWKLSDISEYFLWGVSDIKAFNFDTCIIFNTEKYIYTTNNGNSWNLKYNPSSELYSYFFINNKYFWAGGSNGKLLHSSNGLGLFSGNNVNNIPNRFYLYQNYPNPFNPVTTIKYELPETGFVTLKLYDITGREVKSIVNGVENKGIHVVQSSLINISSGIYFIQLRQSDFVMSRKMVLIK